MSNFMIYLKYTLKHKNQISNTSGLVGKQAGSSQSPKTTSQRRNAPILDETDRAKRFVQSRGKIQPTLVSAQKKGAVDASSKGLPPFKYILPNLKSMIQPQLSTSLQPKTTPLPPSQLQTPVNFKPELQLLHLNPNSWVTKF